jgi:hypothetical protein
MFFLTKQNVLVNIDSIKMIKPITFNDCFKNEDGNIVKITNTGKEVFMFAKIYDINSDSVTEKFKLKTFPGISTIFSELNPKEKEGKNIIAYCIHLSISSGEINNSYETIYILPEEYKKLTENITVIC